MDLEVVFGKSRCFRNCVRLADEYSSTPWPVLLLGETGVGKELLARRIHFKAFGSSKPFVPINCGALPANLFESELFGYERGAFSGAVQNYRGLLRSAQGGTVFLDEIGELDLSLQVKLLRWLDSGEIRSLGSLKYEQVEARLIAATHVDLTKAVANKTFRLDLFERLCVLPLRVPSLKERAEDIPELAVSILERFGAECAPEVFPLLKAFPWPGNVRQLRNVLLRTVARSNRHITLDTLKAVLEEEQRLVDALQLGEFKNISNTSLAEIEKRAIVERIRQCQGNKKKAAKELGIAKSTLHEKIRRWGSQPSRCDARPAFSA
jgi:transcriptional regulator with PAS, ATPase and Fis domain